MTNTPPDATPRGPYRGWLPLFPYKLGEEWSTVEQRVLDWLTAQF